VVLEKEGENQLERRVMEESIILPKIKWRQANWIGYILRKNCLLKHVTGEKLEGKESRGKRRKELLDDLNETMKYWTLKHKALQYSLLKIRFGRGSDLSEIRPQKWHGHDRISVQHMLSTFLTLLLSCHITSCILRQWQHL